MAQYIATLRPVGALGDRLASSYEEGSAVFGLVHVPPADVALEHLTTTPASIAFLRFYSQVTWYRVGIGPLQAQAWTQWRVGVGTYGNADPELPPGGDPPPLDVLAQVGGADIDTTPALGAWTVADVNALGLRGVFFVDDAGSGDTTVVREVEVWVEVWGEPAAGDATGVVRATGTAAVEVGGGEVASQAAATGTAGVEVGAGEVTTSAVASGTAGVEIGSGWV